MGCIGHKDALSLEGKCIDKYRFCRLLECGENVFVYLGYDMHTESPVAIKVVHCAYADEARLQLFNEKALLAILVYPRIVRMYDFVVSPPFTLLVTEYAARGSLRNCLNAHTKLPVATRVKYIVQAAEALQYMHDKGYIHRDVKPENMLLTPDDSIVLCDLGIAMPIPSGKDRVNSMGTATYVAPEQIEGYPSQKSDQYSLAIVAYELFCGVCPFSGSPPHLVWKQMFLPPLFSHSRWKKLPAAAEQVIKQALAKEPDQRFSRIETFALELANALHSPSLLSGVTDEIECIPKAQRATDIMRGHTTDCEQQYPHTSLQHPAPPNTASLE
jgi:serine/threonine protein kinase